MEELPVRTLSVPSQSPPTGRRKKLSGSLATTTVEPSAEPSNTASSSRKIPVSKEDSSRPILHIKPLADPYNDPPLQKLLDALETSFDDMANDKTPMTVTKLLNRFWFTYKFPYYKPKEKGPKQSGKHRRPIEEVFHRNAKDLLQLIHKDKYGVIYEWLEELAQQPLRLEALHPDQFPYIIVPRETSNRRASQMQLETNETSSRASSPRTPRTPPRVGKSLKQPGRSVKSVLRPITSTKKRSRQDSDVGATTDASPSRKSQHVAVDNNSSSSDDNDASMDMDVDMDLSNSEDPSDINLESNDTHDPIMKLFEERISTVIPRGNTRPWVCTESDCGFSVRSGDDMIDRAKIKDHMDGHRRSSRMDIIMAEQRSHLPIGYEPAFPFTSIPSPPPSSPPLPFPRSRLDFIPRYEPFLTQFVSAADTVIVDADNDMYRYHNQPAVQANQQHPLITEEQAFHDLVTRYRRTPHPVSDKLISLTRI